MLKISLFLLVSTNFIILEIILIILFMKQLKFIRIFIEEMHRDQIIINKELLQIKRENNNQKENTSKEVNVSETKSFNSPDDEDNLQRTQVKSSSNIANNKQTNLNTTELKSSQVSEQELQELLKGKEQIFNKQVNIQNEKMFVDFDIDITDKK